MKEHATGIRYSALTAYAEPSTAIVVVQVNGATAVVQRGSAAVALTFVAQAVSWACATKSHQVELLRVRMAR